MKNDEFRDLLILSFATGVLVGVAAIMLILVFVRNITEAQAAEIEATPEYIEITEGPESAVEVLPELEELGRFRITFYCRCGRCNGYFKDGSPRSVNRYGEPLKWGMIAVDPKVIPMHTKVMIDGFDGVVFEAVDTGGENVTGKQIDIFYPGTHKEALRMNDKISRATVWKIME